MEIFKIFIYLHIGSQYLLVFFYLSLSYHKNNKLHLIKKLIMNFI